MRRSDLLLWLVSLGIAVALLVLVRGERRVTVAYAVSVEAELPAGTTATSPLPDEVTVVVSGPWARLRVLDAEAIGPVRLDVARGGRGLVAWHARPEALHVPAGARVESLSPAQGTVELRRDVH